MNVNRPDLASFLHITSEKMNESEVTITKIEKEIMTNCMNKIHESLESLRSDIQSITNAICLSKPFLKLVVLVMR